MKPKRSRARTSPTTSTDGPRAARTRTRPRLVFVAIGIGSNQGRREDFLRRSIAALARSPHVEGLRASPFYETSPVPPFPPQRAFLNAVITARARLSAPALLTLLRKSENALGRSRTRAARNRPRTLDLDLLLYGDRRIRTRRLVVPHPRMTSRLFVLVPLADLAPGRVVPGTRKTVARLLAEARRTSTERVRPWRPLGLFPRDGRTRTPSA